MPIHTIYSHKGGQGVTSISAALATLTANTGHRTLIIDTGTDQAAVHGITTDKWAALGDYLTTTAVTLDDITTNIGERLDPDQRTRPLRHRHHRHHPNRTTRTTHRNTHRGNTMNAAPFQLEPVDGLITISAGQTPTANIHHPESNYCRYYWVPIIGPGAWITWANLVAWLPMEAPLATLLGVFRRTNQLLTQAIHSDNEVFKKTSETGWQRREPVEQDVSIEVAALTMRCRSRPHTLGCSKRLQQNLAVESINN
jgi:hypothetical protein